MTPARVALLLLLPAPLPAAQGIPDSTCQRFEGTVGRGEPYEVAFTQRLRFRLDPDTTRANPSGWTIRVVGLEDASHDFSMVATPPYRFWNPRYLDTSYGMDAAQAAAIHERRFRFVLTEGDYTTAFRALGILLWPAGHSAAEEAAARDTLETRPIGSGVFRILAATTLPATAERPGGSIETVEFSVALCVPRARERP